LNDYQKAEKTSMRRIALKKLEKFLKKIELSRTMNNISVKWTRPRRGAARYSDGVGIKNAIGVF